MGDVLEIMFTELPAGKPVAPAPKAVPTQFPGVFRLEPNRIYDNPVGYGFAGEGGEPEYFMHRYMLGIMRDKKRMKRG